MHHNDLLRNKSYEHAWKHEQDPLLHKIQGIAENVQDEVDVDLHDDVNIGGGQQLLRLRDGEFVVIGKED